MNWGLLLALAAGAAALVLSVRLLMVPIRLVFKLVLNGAIGLAILWLMNLAGGTFGLHLGMNPVTALTAGLLGVPGVILLVALYYIMHA